MYLHLFVPNIVQLPRGGEEIASSLFSCKFQSGMRTHQKKKSPVKEQSYIHDRAESKSSVDSNLPGEACGPNLWKIL